MKRKILITGGAGAIGTGFATWSADRHELTMLDLPGRFSTEHESLGTLIEADTTDFPSCVSAVAGMDTVIHLAGDRKPSAAWSSLLPSNIIGTYNIVSAAMAAGVKRIIYASSVHTVTAYDQRQQIREDDPVRPSDLYGVSKCFGEALGSYASSTGRLSFIALRIGAFQPLDALKDPGHGWMLRDYCAPEDLFSLIQAAIDAPSTGFEIYNAVSDNTSTRLSMEKARRDLGYESRHDSFRISDALRSGFETVGSLDDQPQESGMRHELAEAARLLET